MSHNYYFLHFFTFSDTLDGAKIQGKTIVGWIYSHVREKSMFIRSLAIHTQHSLQRTNSKFFGIIMHINNIGQYEDHKMYRLTEKRMKTVNDCLKNYNGTTPRIQHSACSGRDLYQSISYQGPIFDLSLTIFHSQQFQTVAYSVRNRQRAKRKIISDDDSEDDFQSSASTSTKTKSKANDAEQMQNLKQTICQNCNEEVVYILKHLAKKKICKESYGEDEYKNLKAEAKKGRNATYNKKNREERKINNATYYRNNKDSISQRKKENHYKQKAKKSMSESV